MGRCGVLAFVAALLVSFVAAQTTVLTATPATGPTATWTIAAATSAACTAGSNPPGTISPARYGGGMFTDGFGDYWQVDCGQEWTSMAGTVYYDGTGVSGSGATPVG